MRWLSLLSHPEAFTPCLACCLQYFELACMFYAKFIMVASCILYMTLTSSFVSTYKLYKKRSELFRAVGQQRLIPIVFAGRVRSDLIVYVGLAAELFCCYSFCAWFVLSQSYFLPITSAYHHYTMDKLRKPIAVARWLYTHGAKHCPTCTQAE